MAILVECRVTRKSACSVWHIFGVNVRFSIFIGIESIEINQNTNDSIRITTTKQTTKLTVPIGIDLQKCLPCQKIFQVDALRSGRSYHIEDFITEVYKINRLLALLFHLLLNRLKKHIFVCQIIKQN